MAENRRTDRTSEQDIIADPLTGAPGESDLRAGTSGTGLESASASIKRDLENYLGYDVVDRNGNNIGTLDCIWADRTGEPAFVGVTTGWFFGKTHVVPAASVEVSEHGRRLRLPYSAEKVKSAPAYDSGTEMSDEREREVYRFYGLERTGESWTNPTPPLAGAAASEELHGEEEARMPLAEERMKVGKREVDAGGVRLRKIVRTETVNQPVELRREDIVIEREPASQGTEPVSGQFEEKEVYIPLRREEPVVEKEVVVNEEVRARKQAESDTRNVSGSVRKEDVEIEKSGDAKDRFDPNRPQTAEEIRERENLPRSQRQHTP